MIEVTGNRKSDFCEVLKWKVIIKGYAIIPDAPSEHRQQPETYQQMLAHLVTQDTIAIDTESNSLHAYYERFA